MASELNTLVRLLGRPQVERHGHLVDPPRGRKTWALLAYLTLSERAPGRRRIASLLCCDAVDPLRALRWCLSETRRLTGWGNEHLSGDPLMLSIPADCHVDARRLLEGASRAARRRTLGGARVPRPRRLRPLAHV